MNELDQAMDMFISCGETMVPYVTLQNAIEGGEFEDNGFASNREEAVKLGQLLVEAGYVCEVRSS